MSRIAYNDENLRKIREAAEELRGSCKSLDDVLQAHFEDDSLGITDFDIELLRELDSITMECQGCNWWCEPHELNEDQVCEDCSDE